MDRISKLGLLFLGTFLLTVVLSLILGGIMRLTGPIPVYVTLVLSQAAVFLPAGLFLKREGKAWGQIAPKKRLGLGNVLLLLLIAVCTEPVAAFLNTVSSILFGNAVAGLSEEMMDLPFLLNVLFVAVMPAILEELVFRGVFYGGFRQLGFWKAALGSALFFGLMHGNLNQFTYTFVLGIVLCFSIEAVGSIRASMTIHFGINFISVYLVRVLSTYSEEILSAASGETVLESAAAQTFGGMEIYTVALLGMGALVSAGICGVLIWLLARLNNRDGYLVWMLTGGERQALAARKPVKLFTPAVIGAVAAAAFVIIILTFLA